MKQEIEEYLNNEIWSEKFIDICKGLVVQSAFKYGSTKKNFITGNCDAVQCMKNCINKYEETKNLEYLCDAANYAMIRYMYPQKGDHFEYTSESAGVAGITETELKAWKEETC